MRRLPLGTFAIVACAVILLSWTIGVLLSPTRTTPAIQSDALGPENGQLVQEYLDYAQSTMAEAELVDSAPAVPYWALATFSTAFTAQEVADIVEAAGVSRISLVIVNVPVDRVAMPVISVAVPSPPRGEHSYAPTLSRAVDAGVNARALGLGGDDTPLVGADAGGPGDARTAAEIRYTAGAIAAGQGSIVGVVVYSPVDSLQRLAKSSSHVRAVEVLPADAVWGRFAVRPLLPGHLERVQPLADDGAVPEPPQPAR